MSQRYLVLDSDPFDDGLRWNLDRALAAALPELDFEYRFRRKKTEQLIHDIWEAADTKAILTLVSDRGTPAHYVMIEAGDEPTVDRVADALDGELPVIALRELQARASRVDEDPAALVRLALGTEYPAPDLRSAELIAAGFRHEQPLIRYRAVQAAALAPTDEFHATLDELARDDPDPSVRGMAETAIRALRPPRS
jgi:hypothetical protein